MSTGFVPRTAPAVDLSGLAAPTPLTAALESAHAELRRAAALLGHDVEPPVDLAPAAGAVGDAFVAMYDAADGREDTLASVLAARAAIDRAAAVVAHAARLEPSFARVGEHLARSVRFLRVAESRIAIAPPPPPAAPPDLCVSVDVPRLHALARPSLAPILDVPAFRPADVAAAPPALLPQPKTFAELGLAIARMKERAASAPARPAPSQRLAKPALPEPPPGFALAPPPAMSDADFIRARTRECFEEVAMTGMQRAPLLGDPWRSGLVLERRMLASLDVIASLGPVAIAFVPRLVADAPVKDPSRGFALAMILGCIQGRDALGAVELALSSRDVDGPFLAEIAAASKLVPHDALPFALRSWLAESDPRLRALAVSVLAYRGLATPDDLARAAADHPLVAAEALVPLAYGAGPIAPGLLEAACASDGPALRKAAWTARVLVGHPHTTGELFGLLDGPDGETAGLLIALGADEPDSRALVARGLAAPTRALIHAIGWVGASSSIGPLIDVLASHPDDEVRLGAAYALDRITDAGLWEETDVLAEEIAVADPPEPDVGEPRRPRLAEVVGDARDPVPAPATERVDQPSLDPARWRAYMQEHGASYDLGARYRRGQPHSPAAVLREADAARATPVERRWMARELFVRVGEPAALDPHDFVIVQEQAITTFTPIAARASSLPGRWARPARRG